MGCEGGACGIIDYCVLCCVTWMGCEGGACGIIYYCVLCCV